MNEQIHHTIHRPIGTTELDRKMWPENEIGPGLNHEDIGIGIWEPDGGSVRLRELSDAYVILKFTHELVTFVSWCRKSDVRTDAAIG